MHSIKACIWCRQGNERCGSVALYLGSLALGTVSGPSADIRSNAGPHIPGRDEFLGCPNARMRELVQRVEKGAAETLRYEWTRVASRHTL